jgi:aspartokinase/homoserine dehydrogenase 1
MKVLKFGGTSVGSIASIQTLLNILAMNLKMEKTGGGIISHGRCNQPAGIMAEDAANGKEFTAALAELEKRHFDVVKSPAGCAKPKPGVYPFKNSL